MVGGQVNLTDAIDGHDRVHAPRRQRVPAERARPATLLVRPRGWHLPERTSWSTASPVAGALMDFGLYVFHNARRLLDRGTGPYFYLPKLETHLEARLWNDVFVHAEDDARPRPRHDPATVLDRDDPAAFEMDEILYELREHSAGLNAGRWDYIFSMIKRFRERPEFVLPDRNEVTMTVPVHARLHRAAGADLPPPRRARDGRHGRVHPQPQGPGGQRARRIAKVRADKEREASDGFDGTWVAHPDFVATALEQFDAVLGDRPNQVDRQRDDVDVGAGELLDVASTPGAITEAGCATTSTSASSTSRRGCAATARRASTA